MTHLDFNSPLDKPQRLITTIPSLLPSISHPRATTQAKPNISSTEQVTNDTPSDIRPELHEKLKFVEEQKDKLDQIIQGYLQGDPDATVKRELIKMILADAAPFPTVPEQIRRVESKGGVANE